MKIKFISIFVILTTICPSVWADETKNILFENFMKNQFEQAELLEANILQDVQNPMDKLENLPQSTANNDNIQKSAGNEIFSKELNAFPEYQIAKKQQIIEYINFINSVNHDSKYFELKNQWKDNYKKSDNYKETEKNLEQYYKKYGYYSKVRLKNWQNYFSSHKIDLNNNAQNRYILASLQIILNKDYNADSYKYQEYQTDEDIRKQIEYISILLSKPLNIDKLSDADFKEFCNILNSQLYSDKEFYKIATAKDFDLLTYIGLKRIYNGTSFILEYYDYLKELEAQNEEVEYTEEELVLYGKIRNEKFLTIEQKKSIIQYPTYYGYKGVIKTRKEKAPNKYNVIQQIANDNTISNQNKYDEIIQQFEISKNKIKKREKRDEKLRKILVITTSPIWAPIWIIGAGLVIAFLGLSILILRV